MAIKVNLHRRHPSFALRGAAAPPAPGSPISARRGGRLKYRFFPAPAAMAIMVNLHRRDPTLRIPIEKCPDMVGAVSNLPARRF